MSAALFPSELFLCAGKGCMATSVFRWPRVPATLAAAMAARVPAAGQGSQSQIFPLNSSPNMFR